MDLTANSVKEAINHLTVSSEDLKDQLFEKDGRLRRFVRVFVNGEPVSLASDSDPKLKEGSEVTLLLALAGG